MLLSMSNLELDSAPTEVIDAPVVDGQGEATLDASEAPAAPEYDYLDIDDTTAGKYVRAKVGDEEVPVTLQEALQGYQRHADYTRKTQETASLRREAEDALRLQQAIQSSPGLTMQILARQAGVSVEEYLGLTPQQAQQAQPQQQTEEYLDPLERQLAEERQARMELQQRFEDREADEYLRGQVARLRQTYGIDQETARQVVGRTINAGLGPESFGMIYESMEYQRMRAVEAAQQEAAQQRNDDDARRRQAAASASATVQQGTGATNVEPVTSANGITTPREAILAALESLERR